MQTTFKYCFRLRCIRYIHIINIYRYEQRLINLVIRRSKWTLEESIVDHTESVVTSAECPMDPYKYIKWVLSRYLLTFDVRHGLAQAQHNQQPVCQPRHNFFLSFAVLERRRRLRTKSAIGRIYELHKINRVDGHQWFRLYSRPLTTGWFLSAFGTITAVVLQYYIFIHNIYYIIITNIYKTK